MKKVYIAQLKCSSNHCVLALAGEFEDLESAEAGLFLRLGREMGDLVTRKVLKYECGLCLATELHLEVGVTRFLTMTEALPELLHLEHEQAETREMFKRRRE